MIPLIYIAGPLGAPTPLGVRRNVERARDLGLKVAECGAYPIIPHCNTGEFYGHALDDPRFNEATLWGPGTMELLYRCDAIVLTDDWFDSKGASAEKLWADSVGMPAFVYDESTLRGEDPAMSELWKFVHAVIQTSPDQLSYRRMMWSAAP